MLLGSVGMINYDLRLKQFWEGKKVLITGHTGFKGSWLSIALSSLGANVFGISLPPVGCNNLFNDLNLESIVESEFIDIRDLEDIREVVSNFSPDILFHLAAQPLVIESIKRPKHTFDVNIMGTVNILEVIKSIKSLRSSIIVTSDKCYDNIENNEYYYKEVDALGGLDPYSASKGACEIVSHSYRRTFNLNLATVRSGNVIGGGDRSKNRLIPDIVDGIINKKVTLIRCPEAIRPWQHVSQPIIGYMRLAERLYYMDNGKNYAFNFGPGLEEHCSVLEIVKYIQKSWGAKFEIVPDINSKESFLLKLDSSLSKNLLQWSPTLGIEKTINETINWYKYNEKNKGDYLKLRDFTTNQFFELTKSTIYEN